MTTKIMIAYVHDRPGVLTKIASIFYRRDMNILTLTAGQTTAPDVTKVVFRVQGSDEDLHRLLLSVDNLIDVISIDIQEDASHTARELCLARIRCGQGHSDDALRTALTRFETRLWKHEGDSIVLEIVDSPERIDAFIAALDPFDLIDLSRTGATAIPSTTSVQGAQGYDDSDNVTSLMQHMYRL